MTDVDDPIAGIQEISLALRKTLDRERALKKEYAEREERHKEVGYVFCFCQSQEHCALNMPNGCNDLWIVVIIKLDPNVNHQLSSRPSNVNEIFSGWKQNLSVVGYSGRPRKSSINRKRKRKRCGEDRQLFKHYLLLFEQVETCCFCFWTSVLLICNGMMIGSGFFHNNLFWFSFFLRRRMNSLFLRSHFGPRV